MDIEVKKLQTEILNTLKSEEVIDYIKDYDICSMVVFGSLITEDFNEYSDIDIALIANNKIDLEDILDIEILLSNKFNRDIDVIDLNSKNLDLFVKINILNTGLVVYTCDENKILDAFKEKTDWIYRENENFINFRRRDVLGWCLDDD